MSTQHGNSTGERGEADAPVRSRLGELGFIAVIAALVVSILVQIRELPFLQPDGMIGSAFFPLSLAYLMLALLVVYMLYLAVAHFRAPRSTAGNAIGGIVTRDQLILCTLIILAIVIGGYIGLFATVGIVLLSGLLVIERVGLRASVTFTLGTLICVYLIFDLWLGMNIGLRALF